MKKNIYQLFVFSCLYCLSCKQLIKIDTGTHPLSVTEAKGRVVALDTMPAPVVIPVATTDFKMSNVTGVKPVQTNTNIVLAVTKTISNMSGPVVSTPVKDSFAMPEITPALDSQITVGAKVTVVAKDMAIKDPNPSSFSYYGKLQGLPHITVGALIEDKAGNIWLGTRGGGLSRFDGQTFTNFSRFPEITNNRVISLIEDRAGNMWFGSEVPGLFKYDGRQFQLLMDPNKKLGPYVKTLMEDRSGNIWIGTNKNGLFKYDGKNFTQYSTGQGLSHESVTALIEDNKGRIWIGTEKGVNIFDGTQFLIYNQTNGLPDNSIRSLLQDKQGNIWMGTDSAGVIRYNGSSFINYTKKEGLTSNTIAALMQDRRGNIWMGTEGSGAIKFDGVAFTHFNEQQGFPNKEVRCMLEDRAGNIWFGNYGSLTKLSGIPFNHYTTKEGLLFNQNWSILEDKKGNLWFGSTAGLCKYDGKQFLSYTKDNGLPARGIVRSLTEDKQGYIWIGFGDGAGGGFAKFDGNQFRFYKDPFTEKDNAVQGVMEDSKGNIWLANSGNGIYKYDGKSITIFTKKQGLPTNSFNTSTEDRNGNIWFTTANAGVVKYNGKKFIHYSTNDGLPGNSVWASLEDEVGNLWFGTEKGLARFDGKYFTTFTDKEGLAGVYPLTLTMDKEGNLWCITRNGINKLPKDKARQNYREQKLNDNGIDENLTLFRNFEYADGFLGMGGQSGNTLLSDRNGNIWACSNDRVSVYNTALEAKTIEAPKTRITGISLYEQPIDWPALSINKDSVFRLSNGVTILSSRIKFDSLIRWHSIPYQPSLPYDNNYMTFHFTGITMYQPAKVKYQYILEGNDKNWSALSSASKASYSNLAPGNYTFKVKAMDSQGQWSNEHTYAFTIRPPWWQTWWAYLLYFILITGTVAIFIRYRSRQLREENARLEGKVERRTAELNKTIEDLKSTQQQLIQSEKMASLGELTAGIAHEIQNPLNFVNNFSEINTELIDELQKELKTGNTEDAIAISNDIKDNEQKINHHGKRADAIVKGMLQHSRSSSGQKEPTDINALCDEYLRLAYHGLRAKDKSFNASFETQFDDSIGKVLIQPQEMGRVILNLINNAFYAVAERSSSAKASADMIKYEPKVIVSTEKKNNAILISVKDNGTGIPQKVVDKIFQPFFTTKPTGQGTGLGLSLSYDIVKAHGGELKVETEEGSGSIFIIQLPFKSGE